MNLRFVFVAGFCLFSIYSANTVLSSMLPTIGSEFSLSPVVLGLIVSAYGWSYAAMQIPVGIVSDIFEPRKMSTLSLLAFFLSTLGFAFSPSGIYLILSRILMGVGGSFIFVVGLKSIEYVYDEKERGLAVGIFSSLSFCGIAIPNLIASLLPLTSMGHWRLVYLGVSFLALIGSLASFVFFPKNVLRTGSESPRSTLRKTMVYDVVPIIGNKRFMIQNIIAFTYFGSFFGVLFWLPSYFQSLGESEVNSGIAVFLLGIGAVIGFSSGGWLIHKYGKEMMNLRFFLLFYTCFLFVLILIPESYILSNAAILSFLIGLGVGGSVANTRIVGNLFNKNSVGTAYGVFNTIGWLGSAFYPLLVGYVLSAGFVFQEAFLPLGVSMIIAVILSAFSLRSTAR